MVSLSPTPAPVVWVGPHAPSDPSLPPGSLLCTTEEVVAWLDAHVPTPLADLRRRGASASCSDHADRATRSAVRQLRTYLAPRHPASMAQLAAELDMSVLAAALSQWPEHSPVTCSTLASAVSGTPRDEVSRLLMALEHL